MYKKDYLILNKTLSIANMSLNLPHNQIKNHNLIKKSHSQIINNNR